MCSVCFKFWGKKNNLWKLVFATYIFFSFSLYSVWWSYGHLNTPVQTLFVACSQSDKASFRHMMGPCMRQRRIILNCESYCKLSQQNPAPLIYSLLVTTAHQLPPPHPITSILCHMDALHGAQNEHHSYLLKRTVVYRHRLFTVHNKPRHSFLASKSFWALVLLSPNFQLPFFFFFKQWIYTEIQLTQNKIFNYPFSP